MIITKPSMSQILGGFFMLLQAKKGIENNNDIFGKGTAISHLEMFFTLSQ